MRLEGKVAIVTGAARGIGRGIALRLAQEGASIVIADILSDLGEETAELIQKEGGRALALTVDVTIKELVQMMVERTLEEYGQIDILVNDAGIMGRKHLVDITEPEWDRMMDVNLKGVFLCSQAVVRYFLEQGINGKIVNIASVEAEIAFPDQVHYAASKAGVAMLTKAMAYDLGPLGINVNAVGPGTVDSHGRLAKDPQRLERYHRMIPKKRVAVPRDVAGAVAFLASDDADYITGHILYVDGGMLTH